MRDIPTLLNSQTTTPRYLGSFFKMDAAKIIVNFWRPFGSSPTKFCKVTQLFASFGKKQLEEVLLILRWEKETKLGTSTWSNIDHS